MKKLKLYERLLMYSYSVNNDIGRDFSGGDWYNNIRETILRYSSYYIHSLNIAFANIISWDEIIPDENNVPKDNEGNLFPDISDGFGYAKSGIRSSFYKQVKKLNIDGYIYCFNSRFRALKGIGGIRTPVLDLYNHKNQFERPKDIIAYSLTEKGYNEAKSLCAKHQNIEDHQWEFHRLIVKNKDIAKKIYGKP